MNLLRTSKSINAFLTGLTLLLSVLAGCGKKPNYEGGHIALFYDTDRWELSYQETEPYPTFHLQYDDNEITIMLAENDGSIVEAFYNDTVSLYQTFAERTSRGRTDEWDSKSWLYYEDLLTNGTDSETVITYAKKQDNMLIVGLAEIMTLESGKENTELTKEALEILSSMEYSEQSETGDLSEIEEQEYIRYMNDMLQMLVSFNPVSEEDETEGSTAVSDKELSALQYIKKAELEDFYGDKSKYHVYAPKDNTYENGFLYWSGHGLTFSASALNLDTTSYMYEYLSNIVESTTENWQEGMDYRDIGISEVMKNGDDRYLIAAAITEDFYGTPFQVKEIFYMDMQAAGAGVFWDLNLYEINVDDETDAIIDELAKCYNIDLNVMKTDGEWVKGNAERIEKDQDIYEPREGDNVLEPVEGYRYMGMTVLDDGGGAVSCPVMIPMGSSTIIRDSDAYSHLHGVIASVDISRIFQSNFMLEAKGISDRRYHTCENDTENKRNVWKSELIPLSGYDEAYCVLITYEEKNTLTEEYESQARIYCYIKIDDSYYLEYSITLLSGEYDNSTNTVIKELETAYGIDLSAYYAE